MSKTRPVSCASLLAAVVLALAPVAGADRSQKVSAEARAAAQALFEQGRKLLKEDKPEKACPKLEESMRLDPAPGTQLNLALCYEKVGRVASAWINFIEAAATAKKEGNESREKAANEHAADLEPRLSRMTIKVDRRETAMVVERDGVKVGSGQWDTAVPVDPGRHRIVASAPGKKEWSTSVAVEGEGKTITVRVPALPDAPSPPPVEGGGAGQKIAALVTGLLGLGGVGVGTAFGVIAMNKKAESLTYCRSDDPNRCLRQGVELRNQAMTASHVSTAGFVGGGALLVTGLVLVVAAPSGASGPGPDKEGGPRLRLMAAANGGEAGLSVGGCW